MPDPHAAELSSVRRVVLCAGKVCYDLEKAREAAGAKDVAIVRLERLYPLPADELRDVMAGHDTDDVVWLQEEPANQGAWPYVALNVPEVLGGRTLRRISRSASASPAAGSHTTHETEHKQLLAAAFA